MKILVLASNLRAIGGIQAYNRKFIDALRKEGEAVRIAELRSTSPLSKLRFVFCFFIEVIYNRPDFIFATNINFSPLAYFMRLLFKRPYIVTAYGIDIWNVQGVFWRKILCAARAVITISRYTKTRLLSVIAGLEEKNIILIPPPVDGTVFTPGSKNNALIQKYGISPEEKIILSVGRIDSSERYKGFDRVIRALSKVRTTCSARCVIVGDGDDVPRLHRIAEEEGVSHAVTIVGSVSEKELVDWYRSCDVFIMPSTGEGFGIVFIEALSCGKPVIGGNCDGSRDAILDGVAGLLINPKDISQIADAIVKVLRGEVNTNLQNPVFLRERALNVFGCQAFENKVKDFLSTVL